MKFGQLHEFYVGRMARPTPEVTMARFKVTLQVEVEVVIEAANQAEAEAEADELGILRVLTAGSQELFATPIRCETMNVEEVK